MEQEIYKEKEIADFHIPRWEELPNLDLYVDQVICVVDDALSNFVSKEKEGHVITKSMINNYVKHNVIKPAINKKYNKEHIANLFVICILKPLYSINDIATMIKSATKSIPIQTVYNNFCESLENAISAIFAGKEYTLEEPITFDKYVLKRVVYSFANKLYTDKIYLNKF